MVRWNCLGVLVKAAFLVISLPLLFTVNIKRNRVSFFFDHKFLEQPLIFQMVKVLRLLIHYLGHL